MIKRILKVQIQQILDKNKSILLLGPRQTGKSTLFNEFKADLKIDLSITQDRLYYEKNPSHLIEEVKSLKLKTKNIIIDEIQKVPNMLDDIQHIIDKEKVKFLLTGSSARQIYRRGKLNLLPGRLINLRLDAIGFYESMPSKIEDVLLFGQLPEVYSSDDIEYKNLLLKSYVENYIEEEVRQEALVRNVGLFSRFIELAALESGKIVNYSKISKELGPTVATITSYFDILKDCLIVDFIEPISESTTRKKLTKSPKVLFFDLGVRRLACSEGTALGAIRMGELFEHQIGIECMKFCRNKINHSLHFWRDPSGPEVDWVIKKNDHLLPIEVKWTSNPDDSQTKNLNIFMKEYKKSHAGILVCRAPRKRTLKNGITIMPWQELNSIFDF